jgi:hypothetical protein
MPEITDILKEEFERLTIRAKPVYSLAECVAAAGRNDEEPGDDVEDATEPLEEISERFRSCVYLLNDEQLDFLRFASELSDKRAALDEIISYQPFGMFYRSDFAYLFLWEDAHYLVVPEELTAIYREVAAEEGFAAKNARNLELSVYAAGLLQLYGAYEIGWFIEVWNHHHKEKIAAKEAIDFLADQAYFHSDYYFYEDWIVHDCLDDDEFEDLLDDVEDLPYYMPAKSVIRSLSTRGYDDSKIPGEREMNSFLALHVKDERKLDDLQWSVMSSCERLESPAAITDMLTDAGAPVDDETFRTEFERLYNRLRDETHIWNLRGFTPYKYREETGEEIDRFKLPKIKSRKKKQSR